MAAAVECSAADQGGYSSDGQRAANSTDVPRNPSEHAAGPAAMRHTSPPPSPSQSKPERSRSITRETSRPRPLTWHCVRMMSSSQSIYVSSRANVITAQAVTQVTSPRGAGGRRADRYQLLGTEHNGPVCRGRQRGSLGPCRCLSRSECENRNPGTPSRQLPLIACAAQRGYAADANPACPISPPAEHRSIRS